MRQRNRLTVQSARGANNKEQWHHWEGVGDNNAVFNTELTRTHNNEKVDNTDKQGEEEVGSSRVGWMESMSQCRPLTVIVC